MKGKVIMRILYKSIRREARGKDIIVERNGRSYDVYDNKDHSMIMNCHDLREVVDAIEEIEEVRKSH